MIRNKKLCSKCNVEISKSNYNRHIESCKGVVIKKIRGIDYDPNVGYKENNRQGTNHFTKARLLGLPIPKGAMCGK